MRGTTALLLAMLSLGCEPSAALRVDLQTDLVPQVEFAYARSELFALSGGLDGGVALREQEAMVRASEPFREGVRIASFEDLDTGDVELRVGLFTAVGEPVVQRRVRVSVRGSQAVTVLMTRSCLGVRCPGSGDAPDATECLGGQCVPPCEPGEPGCVARECAAASDCEAPTDDCSAAACEEGSCFAVEIPGACPDREACVAGLGCVPTCAAAPETCNRLDDDCDDRFDEGFDTTSDPANCGACGRRCPSVGGTATCVDGECGIQCDPDRGDCDGDLANGCERPLDTAVDCGECGLRCGGATPVCAPGGGGFACESSCPPAAPTLCGGSCVDLDASVSHCGACGAACGASETCVAGACRCGARQGSPGGGAACDAGEACCGSTCVDTDTDPSSCGGCGIACGPSEACVAGRCACAAEMGSPGGGAVCAGAETCCPSAGCVDTDTQRDHCGGCGVVCGAMESCVAGQCACEGATGGTSGAPRCAMPTECCPGFGCVVTDTDTDSCGACGAACGAGETCTGGSCRCDGTAGPVGAGAVCGASQTCCATLGCVNLDNDTGACGACTARCGAGETCSGGACDCAGEPGTGGTGTGGQCVGAIGTCCPGDGCVSIVSDTNNCGACGAQCGAGETCMDGSCRCLGEGGTGGVGGGPRCTGATGTCCPTVGCLNTANDVSHCGGCNVTCGASETCSGGSCRCGPAAGPVGGGAVCAGAITCCPASGCEDTLSDAANCGGCGIACGPAERCAGGRCLCGLDMGTTGGGAVCGFNEQCCPGFRCIPDTNSCP